MTDQLKINGIYSQGYGMVAKSIMKDRSLSIGAKGLYAYICSYAGAGNTAWPGRERICEDLGINKNTLTKYMIELKERDYIRIEQRKDEKGKFIGNVFWIVQNPSPLLQKDNNDDSEKPCIKKQDTVEKPRPKKQDTEPCPTLPCPKKQDNNININNFNINKTTTITCLKENVEDKTQHEFVVVVGDAKLPVNEGAVEICWQAVLKAKGVDIDRKFIVQNLVKYADRGGLEYFLEKVEVLKQTAIKTTIEGFLARALAEDWKPGKTESHLLQTRADEKKKALMAAMYS
ncbi:Helix-turn-helix domain-containing protein [Desulforamulus putei DSM 12395]|uniref:Helix-turn-helix domain-containing protein n=1 Tax=Desulforamulus putei DSM 12395 TaxID=1121429 RepID=A0A1M4USA9_9FIRM|nr:helix-turn-helix domain-containing protein [Desulforamulus putei]SHE59513.1 Helix-turn-helix domain-containing protein [Desulforamulus putei DSM 12395]